MNKIVKPHLRVLHCSDFHFDVQSREHALHVVRKIAEMQRALNVEIVLIAGDVFDSTRQPATFVEDIAEEFLEVRVPTIAIPGNHDVVYDHRDPTRQLFALLEDRSVYISSLEGETIVALEDRLRVWGRGMSEHSPENDPLAYLEGMALDGLWNVVLAHGELMPARDGMRLSSPMTLRDHELALSTVDYMALGHYHYPTQSTHGRTVVRYSGAGSSMIGTGEATLVEFTSDQGVLTFSHRVSD